ncbi:group II intron reverse transcriptase/maturase [Candidatus Venteria ishoeyi]|uniref:RNA-directed DNA polymerase n=1 Tax=Candidatus Venteria ishoeyi TaxID=1899563 RepID=A0A1H6F7B7_9GAMM|nr:group II intron reverse transcriptase/maturase [Candidatus Venteria ishoeyi]SEH05219.1 Group II intron-encoded protein LtrA [Candidatus Venteria ishoeyi]
MELIEQVLDYSNVNKAYLHVTGNKGTKGVDGVTTNELADYMQCNWGRIRQEIAKGEYRPQAVLGVEIPKASGGKRMLGIPTVIDRLIQQSIHQVLYPMYDIEFSEYSYGFRIKRSAHQAIAQAQRYINEGHQYILDFDLKSFFDIVNQDYLMSLLNRKIKDKLLLKLIRRYLQSDMMLGGLAQQREQGMPQGSPLSPLLSNILLTELDKELEKRGLRFVRYADDFSIFVKSKKASLRVKRSITSFVENKLHLKINEGKSQICRPIQYFTLGYGFVPTYKTGEKGKYDLRVSPKSFERLKSKLKETTRKTLPLSLTQRLSKLEEITRGWINYYRFGKIVGKLKDLDTWVRNRLRYCIWKHWKKPNKRMRSFIRLGIPKGQAYAWSRSRMGGWAIAQSPIMKTTITIKRLQIKGYVSFLQQFFKVRKTMPEVQLKLSFI